MNKSNGYHLMHPQAFGPFLSTFYILQCQMLLLHLADSKGSDQNARMRSLIWTFSIRFYSDTFQLDVPQ